MNALRSISVEDLEDGKPDAMKLAVTEPLKTWYNVFA
jgi:hypothetical protein